MVARKKKCFVPFCRVGYSDYSEKATLFNVPTDLSARLIWRKRLRQQFPDRTLEANDIVCERHFEEEFLCRYKEIQNIKYYLARPKLKPGAVPTIFPNFWGESSKVETKILKSDEIKEEFEEPITVICEVKNNFTSTLVLEDTVINYGEFHNDSVENTDEKRRIDKTDVELTEVKIENVYDILSEIPDSSQSGESCEILPNSSKLDCKYIFSLITKENLEPLSWGFQITTEGCDKYIILSQLKLSEAAPYTYKSMVIKEDLSCTIYYLNRKFETLNVSSLEEIQSKLRLMEREKICKGGPKTSSFKPESYNLWVAFEDTSFNCWRHTKCKTVSGKQLRCSNCANLFNYLRTQQLRKPKRDYSKIPVCSGIPNGVNHKQFNMYMKCVKQKEHNLKNRVQAATKKIKRLKAKIQIIKNTK